MNKLPFVPMCFVLVSPCWAEPALPAPKELAALKFVTELHTLSDKDAGFEYRIIEVDSSLTVALNPVSLYLVATNNSPGDELQSRMVILPKASAVKRVRFGDRRDVVYVDAMFDRQNEDGSKTFARPGTIAISVPIKQGKLPESIDVVIKQPDEEQEGQ